MREFVRKNYKVNWHDIKLCLILRRKSERTTPKIMLNLNQCDFPESQRYDGRKAFEMKFKPLQSSSQR